MVQFDFSATLSVLCGYHLHLFFSPLFTLAGRKIATITCPLAHYLFRSPPPFVSSKCTPMSIDIIIAPQSQFDSILQDVKNTATLDVILGADVSIDDVVTIVAIYRNAIDDRPAWWKIRREVNARFSTHPEITTRTLALIPDLFRDELATFTDDSIVTVAARWFGHEGSSPKSLEQANDSLRALVTACQRASKQSSGVFLRTNPPPNAFELAFSELSGNALAKYRRVYDKLDDKQKHEAHQKFNYYQKQGLENSLAQVLRDLTRKSTKKVNLKTDQRAIQRHIAKRVKEYCKTPRPTAGNPDAPITLIMLTFDIEYEGYIDFGFDTREDARANIRLEEHTEGCLEFITGTKAFSALVATSYRLASRFTTELKSSSHPIQTTTHLTPTLVICCVIRSLLLATLERLLNYHLQTHAICSSLAHTRTTLGQRI